MLREPNGIILHGLIYTGHMKTLSCKGHNVNEGVKMMDGKLNVGHHLYMDNFYNS